MAAANVAPSDTLGRLGASQFVGTVTLHAETSPGNPADDPTQPVTTTWFGSDDPLMSQNDPFNPAKMEQEFRLMLSGHRERHAYVVEPSGLPGFLERLQRPVGQPLEQRDPAHQRSIARPQPARCRAHGRPLPVRATAVRRRLSAMPSPPVRFQPHPAA